MCMHHVIGFFHNVHDVHNFHNIGYCSVSVYSAGFGQPKLESQNVAARQQAINLAYEQLVKHADVSHVIRLVDGGGALHVLFLCTGTALQAG